MTSLTNAIGIGQPSSVYFPSVDSVTTAQFPADLGTLKLLPKPFPDTTVDVLFAEDVAGNRFVIKHHKAADFIVNEFHANRAFKALGLPVAEAKLYQSTSLQTQKGTLEGNFLVLQYIPNGKDLTEVMTGNPSEDRVLTDRLAQDFIKICLMGAWDFVGLCYNNILVANDQYYYIDQGLTFGYMHNGAKKSEQGYLAGQGQYAPFFNLKTASDWWDTCDAVPEILSLRDYNDRLGTAIMYTDLTTQQIQEQINALDLTELRALTEQGEFPHEIMDVLERRTAWLKQVDLSQFEGEWTRMNEARAKAVAEAGMGQTPLFASRGMELFATVNGGCFSQIPKQQDPADRPPTVGIIYREVTKDHVWLQMNAETGTFSLPTWKAKDPKNQYISEVTFGSFPITGTRTRISSDFVSSDINGTRYYVVDRMGGMPKSHMQRFTMDEAMQKLSGSDREVLKAYLHAAAPEQYAESTEVSNITPVSKKK